MNNRETAFPLFRQEIEAKPIAPCDPNVKPADVARLSTQAVMILNRLKRGPASNRELSSIALKYTSRISDIRAAGIEVECEDRGGGLNFYTLKGSNT